MHIIYKCYCGCEMVVFRDKFVMFQSLLVDPAEIVTFIDDNGFINGKYSISHEGLLQVQQELEFEYS